MAGKDMRAERLKAQLRANLRRRKAPEKSVSDQRPPEDSPEPPAG